MEQRTRFGVHETLADDLDGLRLIALGRIPRCASCPRYHTLLQVHDRGRAARLELARVPDSCTHQVCAPLARRYKRSGRQRGVLVASAL